MSTLDGSTFASFGLIEVIEPDIPILPETRDRTIEIPKRDGAYDFGADMGPRRFSIPLVWKDETSKANLQSKIRTFASFLTDTSGKPRNIILRFDDEIEKYYTVRYAGSLPIQRLLKYGFFDLPMIAFDPSAYALLSAYDETYLYDTGLEYDTGLIYPNSRTVHDWAFLSPNQMLYMGEREWSGFVWNYPRHMSSQYNYGKSTPLIIEISGDVTNPKITNNNNDQYIQITTTLSNQVLIIDGEKMTVTIDGVNALKYMTGDFIDLEPNGNGFFFDGTSPYAHVTYNWKNKFL